MTVFISYARENREIAVKIYKDLLKANVDCWIDSENLLPGENWKVAIRQNIRTSSYFLSLLSKQSISKRGYVQKELKEALDILDEIPINEIFIIPVRVDQCKPIDSRLVDLNWVDLFPSYEDAFSKILTSINGKKSSEADQSSDIYSCVYDTLRDDNKSESPTLSITVRSLIDENKQIEIKALLDTGADNTFLPMHVLQHLGCRPTGRSREFKGFSGKSSISYPYSVSINLANIKLDHVEVWAWEQSFAIIGRDILNRFRVEFDGPNKTLSLFPE